MKLPSFSEIRNSMNGDYELICYELRAAKRYRRFVSLVLMGSMNGPVSWNSLIGTQMRDSDAVREIGGVGMLLMSETDLPGALTALERYKNRCNMENVRFSVASFPRDGHTADALLDAAVRRLETATAKSDNGAVIDKG